MSNVRRKGYLPIIGVKDIFDKYNRQWCREYYCKIEKLMRAIILKI